MLASRERELPSQCSNKKGKFHLNASTTLPDGCSGAPAAIEGGGPEVVQRVPNRKRRDTRRKYWVSPTLLSGVTGNL